MNAIPLSFAIKVIAYNQERLMEQTEKGKGTIDGVGGGVREEIPGWRGSNLSPQARKHGDNLKAVWSERALRNPYRSWQLPEQSEKQDTLKPSGCFHC